VRQSTTGCMFNDFREFLHDVCVTELIDLIWPGSLQGAVRGRSQRFGWQKSFRVIPCYPGLIGSARNSSSKD
jgi:hypothetical protein